MNKNTAEKVVKVIAVLYWMEAVLAFIGALASLFGSSFFGTAIPGVFATALLSIIGIVMIFIALLDAFVGYGLWKHKNWARIIAIVLAAIGLLSFPIGTILSILVIYFFGFNKEVKNLFK